MNDTPPVQLSHHHQYTACPLISCKQVYLRVQQDVMRLCMTAGVVRGAEGPLLRPVLLAAEIHGETGLDGPQGGRLLPQSDATPLPGKAVNVMYEALKAAAAARPQGCARRVQLVALGALTNVALLLIVYPEVKEWLEIVIMGGALGVRRMRDGRMWSQGASLLEMAPDCTRLHQTAPDLHALTQEGWGRCGIDHPTHPPSQPTQLAHKRAKHAYANLRMHADVGNVITLGCLPACLPLLPGRDAAGQLGPCARVQHAGRPGGGQGCF